MTASLQTAPERRTKCVVCDSEMQAGDETCSICRSPQGVQQCVNCKKRIPPQAKLCSVCKTYQRWWRVLSEFASAVPIVAIIALASGIYTVYTYLVDRNSNIVLKVTGADTKYIYLEIWNTGRKAAAITGYRLKFENLSPNQTPEVTMAQPSSDNTREVISVISPGKDPVIITLVPSSPPIPRPERAKTLSEISVTLELDIEDSDHIGARQQRQDHFSATRIGQLMARLIQ
jgi:hypothetical protein